MHFDSVHWLHVASVVFIRGGGGGGTNLDQGFMW